MNHTGQRIMELRKLNGLTQLDLGRLLYEGLSRNAQQLRVSRLEKSAVVKRKTLEKVATALGVDVSELMAPRAYPHSMDGPLTTDDGPEIHLSPELLKHAPQLANRLRSLNALPLMAPNVRKSLAEILRQWADELEPEAEVQQPPPVPKRNGSDGGPSEL
jgi:transcriptional regulator with XRE-family HTH domain